jgi:hypothetical protein
MRWTRATWPGMRLAAAHGDAGGDHRRHLHHRSLIGTITAGLEARLQELRKGRSRVIEQDFTLILGWSSKVYSIIGELIIANANQKKPRIVILSNAREDRDGRRHPAKFPSTKNTRVICRSGDPLDLDDLAVVIRMPRARSSSSRRRTKTRTFT